MKVILIDVSAFTFRYYHGMPKTICRKSDQFPTNAIVGFTHFMNALTNSQTTPYIGYALLDGGHKHRSDIQPQYKINRKPPDNDLQRQFKVIETIPALYGFHTYRVPGYEADDLIATISTLFESNNQISSVEILTMDKDAVQLLVNSKTYIYDFFKKKTTLTQDVIEKYGVKPGQFIDYQALIGDHSDNIPGVKGIGPKTAVKLINEYGCIENIPEPKFLNTPKANVIASKKVAHLVTNLQMDLNLQQSFANSQKVSTFMKEFDIRKKQPKASKQ